MIWLVWPWSAVTMISVSGMALGPVERDLDGPVELDGLADLAARVLGVVLLVDRGALDLEEEALALVALDLGRQQVDRLGRHVRQVRLVAGRCGFDSVHAVAAGPG